MRIMAIVVNIVMFIGVIVLFQREGWPDEGYSMFLVIMMVLTPVLNLLALLSRGGGNKSNNGA